MNHETMRELSALRLYGELDGGELRELELHLAECAECRRFAEELERGLGSLVTPRATQGDLPADWTTRLERAVRSPVRARAGTPWLAAAAGFVLGAFALGIATRATHSSSPLRSVAPDDIVASAFSRFDGATPPPSATTRGQLAQLSSYLHR